MYERERERGKKCYDVEIVSIVFGMGMTKSWHTAHKKGTYIFDEIIWKTNLLRVFDCGITPLSNSRFVAEFTNITRVNFVQQNIYSSIFRSVYYHSQFQMKWFCVQFSPFDGNFIVFVHILRQSFHVYMFLFFSHSLICYFIFQYLIGGRRFRTDIFDVGFYGCVCNKKSHACEVYSFGADSRKC